MLSVEWRQALLWSIILFVLSWSSLHLALTTARAWPTGEGYAQSETARRHDLFRFDSEYYLDIAENGYSFNGNPGSSPNIVFAPLFPLLVRILSWPPSFSTVQVGFILNGLLLWASLFMLFGFLSRHIRSPLMSAAILLAMTTAAGSYAFHAFYSESTTLFFLALALLMWQRQCWWAMTMAVALLGASRIAALPMVIAFAILLVAQGFKSRQVSRFTLAALLSLSGLAAYLTYIGLWYGNPVVLLSQIQQVSWGAFHPPLDWVELVTGSYLVHHLMSALQKPSLWSADIQTLNLLWIVATLIASFYFLIRRRHDVLTWVFVPYALFIYGSIGASPFLISSHRLLVFFLPIYITIATGIRCLPRKIAFFATVLLLLLNAYGGWLHAGMFNQGIWFWF